MQQSIWKKEPFLPQFSSLAGDLKTDVLIVGGGMAGLLCAFMLEQAGVDYALLEADRICSGTTGYTTAKLTSQHGLIYAKLLRRFGPEKARQYFDAHEAALHTYRTMAKSIACDFESKPSFLYSLRNPRKLEQELQALQRLRIPSKTAETLPLPFPVTGAICFQNQAQFHPLKFAAGIARGLRIYENTPVRAFLGNAVQTDTGTVRAEKIIVATHFPMLNKHGAYFMKLYQQRSYVLALENCNGPEGMYLGIEKDSLSLREQEGRLLLGGGGHRTGKKGSGWEILEAFSKEYYPQARQITRWATQDCMSLDGMPYIGPYSRRTPRLFVATGFNKWGMTGAMLSAMILTELVQGNPHPYASLFSPSRSILQPQLLINGWEALWNLLTPTRPRCPHLGCALKWNRQERSWDCPCHGSRFSRDGTVLDNPATGNLKRSRP